METGPDGPEPLNLSLTVCSNGITITGAEAALDPDGLESLVLPGAAGSCAGPVTYGLLELQRLIRRGKDAQPDG